MKSTKKILSLALALMMVFSLSAVTAFAGEPAEPLTATSASITEPGDSNADVILTAEAAAFDVTVPLTLPISLDEFGEATCADNAKIENNSSGSVIVTNVEITGASDWVIDSYDEDYSATAVNSKLIGFKINNCVTSATDGFAFIQDEFDSIARGDELPIIYDATVAPQAVAINGDVVANVVFTIAWDTVTAPATGE